MCCDSWGRKELDTTQRTATPIPLPAAFGMVFLFPTRPFILFLWIHVSCMSQSRQSSLCWDHVLLENQRLQGLKHVIKRACVRCLVGLSIGALTSESLEPAPCPAASQGVSNEGQGRLDEG